MGVDFENIICKSFGSKLILDPEKLVSLNVISEKELDTLYKILYKILKKHSSQIKT